VNLWVDAIIMQRMCYIWGWTDSIITATHSAEEKAFRLGTTGAEVISFLTY